MTYPDEFTPFEVWIPTMELKWFCVDSYKGGDNNVVLSVPQNYNMGGEHYVLKQKWVDDKGNNKWKSIEIG